MTKRAKWGHRIETKKYFINLNNRGEEEKGTQNTENIEKTNTKMTDLNSTKSIIKFNINTSI